MSPTGTRTGTGRMSVEAFAEYARTHGPCELVDGEVRDMTPVGGNHEIIAGRFSAWLFKASRTVRFLWPGRGRRFPLLALLVLLPLLPACIMPDERIGYYEYRDGASVAVLAADPRQLAEAARRTLEEMEMREIAIDVTEVDAKLAARTADDDGIAIDLDQLRPGATRISVRIGVLGERETSDAILELIRNHLHRPDNATP